MWNEGEPRDKGGTQALSGIGPASMLDSSGNGDAPGSQEERASS